ncbi:diacylglycerol/lipid kinase family protein [Micrococcus lylae]|uniref:diacylglycerol/lipid kinase family protein n=1 Tax=Micrococcus lylae TaxID=1273 RepID=UPI000C7F7D19|nr:diacylglycerol kinase family protein [Micrococcus lylae]WIK81888.1 diacylglycerol kinase family protein [Micrococcus lylae]
MNSETPLEMVLAVIALIAVAAVCLVLVWNHVRVRRLSKQVERLRSERQLLVDRVDQLKTQVDEQSGDAAGRHEVALVINPVKNRADEVRKQVLAAARDMGMGEVLVLETTEEDPGTQMAADAKAAGVRVVIAAGGDGTVRTVAEQLVGTDVRLGIVPMGTGNLLARNLDLPITDFGACIAAALNGTTKTIDTLDVRLEGEDGERHRHTAVVIGGVGLDAEVMGDTRDDLKAKAGWIAYGEAGLRHLPGDRQDATIAMDGGSPRRYKVRSVLVANCGTLQGGLELLPDAQLDDGLLDVMVLSPRHVLDWARIAANTLVGHRVKIPVMETLQGTHVQARFDKPIVSQLDGDSTGEVVGIDARLVADSLTVMLPR